jgi:glutamate-1-semialdehyde 2,1-aminomutase
MLRERSQKIYADLCKMIPGGVSSPVRSFPGLGITPIVAVRGAGDTVWDADDRSYIDFCGSWGALILGHAHPSVVRSAIDQVTSGSTFGMTTPFEAELASLIKKHMPSIEKIRFVSSGTEATMTALRLARGFTGKNIIVKFDGNYHGHSDSLLVKAGSGVLGLNKDSTSLGVPPEMVKSTVSLPYNDIKAVRAFFQKETEVAAVIVEPIAGNVGVVVPSQEFLDVLREETSRSGALLIFDEVITGFRVGLEGAQGYFGITPDLTCLGKVIGGGFPAAAVGGSAEIMDFLAPLGQVYQAGTLSGNPVAMRSGIATLQEIEKPGFFERLEGRTAAFLAPIKERTKVSHVASMFTIFVPDYPAFFLSLFEQGIYFPPLQCEACFISSAHTDEHLKKAQSAILKLLC